MSEEQKANAWVDLINYLTKFDIGDRIERGSLILNIGGDTGKANTVDTYRRILTRLGYLSERTPYKVKTRIPTGLSLHESRRKLNLK